MGVKSTMAGAKLGVKGTMAGAKMGVKGTMATAKGTVGMGKLVAKGGVGLVTDFPGTAINLAETTAKGVVGLPGTLTNLARRQNRRSLLDERLAWRTRITSPNAKIDLSLTCRNMLKKDVFSSSRTFCVVWQVPNGYTGSGGGTGSDKLSSLPSGPEVEVGRTEVVGDTSDPDFSHTFRLDYHFEQEQSYLVRVYDEDLLYATDLREHDFRGGCVFTLGQLMGSPGCTLAKRLEHENSQLYIMAEEIKEAREILEIRFSAQDLQGRENVLDNKDTYVRLQKLNDDQTWSTMWKSEVVKESDAPTWSLCRLPFLQLCPDGFMIHQIKVELWCYNKYSEDEIMGFCDMTVGNLVEKARRGIPKYTIYHEKKKVFGGSKLRPAGMLKALKADKVDYPSMLEHITGGCKFDLTIAVDCSVNNGNYLDEDGLHYRTKLWLNDYQAAIHKIGSIMEPYSKKGSFQLVSFGAEIGGETQAIVQMGDKINSATGLLDAYDAFFGDETETAHTPGTVALVQPIVERAMFSAIQENQKSQSYSVLCILTADIPSDLQATIDSICVAAEDAPLSIVIIGIGPGNFEGMADFFRNGSIRHSNGVPTSRDIVQFSAFSDYGGNSSSVIAEALEEIPEQFVRYFIDSGKKPQPKLPPPDFEEQFKERKRKLKKKRSTRRPPPTSRTQ